MSARDRIAAAWPDGAPDWVGTLADACDRESQRAVAARIGYSATLVNRILGNTYGRDTTAVERAVCGAFTGAVVDCPVLGELRLGQCQRHQRTKRGDTSSRQGVRLWRTCPTCKHRTGGNDE